MFHEFIECDRSLCMLFPSHQAHASTSSFSSSSLSPSPYSTLHLKFILMLAPTSSRIGTTKHGSMPCSSAINAKSFSQSSLVGLPQ